MSQRRKWRKRTCATAWHRLGQLRASLSPFNRCFFSLAIMLFCINPYTPAGVRNQSYLLKQVTTTKPVLLVEPAFCGQHEKGVPFTGSSHSACNMPAVMEQYPARHRASGFPPRGEGGPQLRLRQGWRLDLEPVERFHPCC